MRPRCREQFAAAAGRRDTGPKTMGRETPAVYHCPSCGSLVSARPEGERPASCNRCGFEFKKRVLIAPRAEAVARRVGKGFVQRDVQSRRRPTKKAEPAPFQGQQPETSNPPAGGPAGDPQPAELEAPKRLVRHRKKRPRSGLTPVLFGVGWIICVILIVVLAVMQKKRSEQGGEAGSDEKRGAAWSEAQTEAYLGRQAEEIRSNFLSFFEGATSAGRAQYVYEPYRVAPLMERHYEQNLPLKPQGEAVIDEQRLVRDRGKERIETIWRFGKDGDSREAVFIRHDGRWVLDWEAFVRFSTEPWHLFVGGITDGEGEFRLYMRLRNPQLDEGRESLSVQFYPPHATDVKLRRLGSPVVAIPMNTRAGRRIDRLVEEAEKHRARGAAGFSARDPRGVYRVRVRLAWEDEGTGEEKLAVREILAGHWLGAGIVEDFPADPRPEAAGTPAAPGAAPKEDDRSAGANSTGT